MEKYINHIENQLKDQKESPMLYEFKKQILNDMTARANEITHTGLKDSNVLSDLIISEFSDIKSEYKAFLAKKAEKQRRKRNILYNILGSAVALISGVIIFLVVSFMTNDWGKTWLILDGFGSLWVVYELTLLIRSATKSSKKIFHPGARILLACNVMIITHLVFLICLVLLGIPKSWLLFIFGVIMIFVADGIYVAVNKQRLAILNYLFYIVASSPMVYIIISALGLTEWSRGWLVIPMAILIDMIIIAIKLIIRHSRLNYEEVE